MTITSAQVDRATEISIEEAYEEIELLQDKQKVESGGVEVYSGFHPVHGAVHIILPPVSTGLLLKPFVIRDF